MKNNNNINWMGNKVFDQNSPHSSSRPQPPEWSFTDSPPVVPPSPPSSSPPPRTFEDQLDQDRMMEREGPPPSTDINYIPGYLASNIGKNVRAEFIVGSYQYTDKVGRLIRVGVNYFVLEDVNSGTHIMCDLYSVKFVTIII